MLDLIYTSSKVLDLDLDSVLAAYPGGQMSLVYVKTWDALVCHVRTYDYWLLAKVFRDGTLIPLGTSFSAASSWGLVGSRPQGLHFWRASSAHWPGLFRVGDTITGLFTYQGAMFPDFPTGAGYDPPGVAIFLDAAQQRYVQADSRYVTVFDAEAGESLYQFDCGAYFQGLRQSLAWVDGNKIAVVDHASGNVLFLDYIDYAVKYTTAVRPCVAAAVDCTNNCLVTLEADGKVRSYLLEPQPDSLSSPEFEAAPAQVCTRTGYVIKARLSGSAGEPCPGWVVMWEPPVLGYLEASVSLTDSEGYARNYYYAPESATGFETLQVRARL